MEVAAVCSALIFQNKRAKVDLSSLPDTLLQAIRQIEDIAKLLSEAETVNGIASVAEDFTSQYLKWGLAPVVYAWCFGVPFVRLCETTEVEEGTIVRTLVRLQEVLSEVRRVSILTGDASLLTKSEEASTLIKRDICFCSSLYIA